VVSLFNGDFIESVKFNPLGAVAVTSLVLALLFPGQIQKFFQMTAAKWWQIRARNQYLILIAGFSLLWGANLPRML